MNAPVPRYSVPGLERGLRMLQLFDRSHRLLTAAEMARSLAIPRSTAFRLARASSSSVPRARRHRCVGGGAQAQLRYIASLSRRVPDR
jgi:predicted DNA-binding transcriptional regulator YafY